MNPEELIEKLDWLFKSPLSSNRYNTQEFKEEQFRFSRIMFIFSKTMDLPTTEILKTDEQATEESQIKVGDLTPEGLKFYLFGVRKWREKYDRAKDKIRAINDFAFIEKKLNRFI